MTQTYEQIQRDRDSALSALEKTTSALEKAREFLPIQGVTLAIVDDAIHDGNTILRYLKVS